MRLARRLALVGAINSISALSMFGASPAEACSGLPCVQGYSYPGEDAEIPSTVPALLIRPYGDWGVAPRGLPTVTLRDADGNEVPLFRRFDPSVEPAVLAEPATLLSPGRYTLTSSGACSVNLPNPGPRQTRFRVGPPAPPPGELGSLRVQPSRRDPVAVPASAQCSALVDAVSVAFEVELAPSAVPWSELLLFRTVVDGAQWRPRRSLPEELAVGTSWRGRGSDAIYAECADAPLGITQQGLSEGRHTVRMQAFLPGSGIILQTAPVDIELSCGGSGGSGGGDGSGGGELPGAESCTSGAGSPSLLMLWSLAALLWARRRGPRPA